MHYDAVVIGAGISGACVARELIKYQLSVAVLDKGYDLCAGASRGNSATVHSGHDAAFGTLKASYNVKGNAMYGALCAALHVPFFRNGTLVYAVGERELREIRDLKENAILNGVPGVRILSREKLVDLEGCFGPEVKGALYAPTGGMVSPYELVFALCENAWANGASFLLETRVTCIRKSGDLFRLETDKGMISAGLVVNCAGTHADEMNNFVSENKISILPRKGEHIVLDKILAPYVKSTICQTPELLPGGGHTKGMGIMPSVDGTVLLGCNAQDVLDKDDTSTTQAGLGEILQYFEKNWKHFPIRKAFPDFPRHMVIGAFAGLRAHPAGDDFIIGEAKDVPGFYNVAGIESPGLTAAPAIAEELVRNIADSRHLRINPAFQPERSHEKPFREMTPGERGAAIAGNVDYSRVVCRCETVTRAEVLASIHAPLGAKTLDGVKMRTRAGMGRCQGGYCGPEILKILSDELGIPMTEVTVRGGESRILTGETFLEEPD